MGRTKLNPGGFSDTAGTVAPSGMTIRCAVGFTPEEYERIKQYARASHMPTASAVRQLALAGFASASLPQPLK